MWNFANLRLGVIFLICLCLFRGGQAGAGEPAPGATPFEWGGDAEIGYRFTDVEGDNRYREVVNLEQGFRLFSLNLRFKDPERRGPADDVRFRLNSIGEPFPSGRLDVRKNKVYHFSAHYREYEFFFDREELPSPDPFGTSLTDNHDFNQKRKAGSLSLSLFPSEKIRFDVGYVSAGREGEAGVPRPFTFVPNLKQDLDERFNEYFVSADFPLQNWDFHVKQSYWTFENENRIDEPPTLVEKRNEEARTYVSTVKAHSRLGDRWDFDAGYIYARSEGEARLDTTPAILATSGEGSFVFNTHVLESGLSYLLRNDLLLHFDYRFHTFDQDGRAGTDLLFLPENTVETHYRLYAHTGTLQIEYIPAPDLTVRAGYRAQHRNIKGENFNVNPHDGGPESGDTTIFAQGLIASADWKPFKSLSLFGEYEGTVFDNPYTRISPEDQHVAKARVRYETPIRALTLKGSMLRKRKTNPDQQFRVDVEDYTLTAMYQPPPLPGLSMDGSITYEKIRNKKDIANQSPIPPEPLFTTLVFDSDAVIYSGGIAYEGIYKGLSARFGGTIVRTGKENYQKYARGVVSFWYKGKRLTPVLSFERSYLTDRESPNDGFSANLLTLSLRKEF
jgi:hypothetical protein